MEYTIKVIKEQEVSYLDCSIGARYWEDSEVNFEQDDENTPKMPCVNKDTNTWDILIDLHTGQIQNWIKGNVALIHYKVCDAGVYALLDKNMNKVKEIEGYVPNILCVGESGFGDYVIMSIDENGFIKDFEVTLDEFNANYEDFE